MMVRERWFKVDREKLPIDAEGAVHTLEFHGRRVCLVRLNGRLHAMEDRCPHQGRSFAGGHCEGGYLVCPHHRMRFDPTTGRNASGMTDAARVLPVEETASGIRIALPVRGFILFGFRLW